MRYEKRWEDDEAKMQMMGVWDDKGGKGKHSPIKRETVWSRVDSGGSVAGTIATPEFALAPL